MYTKSYLVVWCLLLLALKLSNCETNGIVTQFNIGVIEKSTNSSGSEFSSGPKCGLDKQNNVTDHTWLARLRYQNDAYGCGGVVLNVRYILTAASCLVGDIVRHLGELKNVTLYEHNGDRTSYDRQIEETVVHSNFRANMIHGENDVALIRLTEIIIKSTPVCSGEYEWDDPHVTGWGQTYAGQKTIIRRIQNVKYVNTTGCNDLLSRYQYEVTPQDICVTLDENNYDRPCPVDGGGILMNRIDSKWWLIGIGSYNAVCGYHERPGVFTKYDKIFSWIKDNVRD